MTCKSPLFITKIPAILWHFGTTLWILGIIDQSFAFLADGALSMAEFVKLFLMFSLCIAWSHLKSENLKSKNLIAENISTLKYYKIDSATPQYEAYRRKTEARMLQIERYHLITQEYILPIPYLCQIYHLLNLKHLESVHSFSLNHLKVTDISQFEPTTSGGIIKFKTILNSSFNLLKVFRQAVVEVELTLHTPYTIELSIPVYGGKKVAIIFNVLPLSHREHKLFIDIYSNLIFPRPILQTLCHFASSLTLLEDLPYLHRLARSNIRSLSKIGKSNRQMMQLFNRFIELYGSSLQEPPSIGAVKLRPISGSSA
jgi:hypothetical protein